MKRLLFLAVLLTGCAQHKIEAQVREALKDPDSARFGEITISDDGSVACGAVNAKNSMGGYTGDQVFMVYEDQVRFQDSDTPGDTLAECCFAAMGRAAGRAAEDASAKALEDSCWRIEPRIVLHLATPPP